MLNRLGSSTQLRDAVEFILKHALVNTSHCMNT